MISKIRVLNEILFKISKILTKDDKKKSIYAFIAIIVSSLLELLGVAVIVPFISAVMDPDLLISNKYVSFVMQVLNIEDISSSILLIMFGILLIFIYILKNICLICSRYIQNSYQVNLKKNLSITMIKSYLSRQYEYFVNTNIAEINRGIIADVPGFINIVTTLFTCLAEFITVSLILGFVLTMDFITSIGLIVIASLCVLIIIYGCKNAMAKAGIKFRESTAQLNKCFYQTFNGIKEIFVMQRRKFFLDTYQKAFEENGKALKTNLLITSLPERIIEVLVVCGIVVIVCIRIIQGYPADEYISQLAAIAVACFRLLPSLNKLTNGVSQIVYNKPCLDSVYANIAEARELAGQNSIIQNPTSNIDGNQLTFEKEIEISDITWRYTNGDRNILEHLSLKIHKGESIALIGESGAGKSTLADIIMGLLQPQHGMVTVDGRPINTDLFQWSKLIGYVPQSVYLIDDTIRNNVAFGIPEEEIQDEMVWNALKQARLDEYISKLPHGLDTIVGDRGIKFSGGQRQRIAIARTMYYDPEIFVLDEATSSLDDETEKAVMESIDSLQGRKTLIIIAHRLSTIQKCDKIYEVTQTDIVERNKSDVFHTS